VVRFAVFGVAILGILVQGADGSEPGRIGNERIGLIPADGILAEPNIRGHVHRSGVWMWFDAGIGGRVFHVEIRCGLAGWRNYDEAPRDHRTGCNSTATP